MAKDKKPVPKDHENEWLSAFVSKEEYWDAFKHIFGYGSTQTDEIGQGNVQLFTYDDLPAPGDGEINPETGFVSIKRIPKHKVQWWKKAVVLGAIILSLVLSQYLGYTNFAAVETTYADASVTTDKDSIVEKYSYMGSGGNVTKDWFKDDGTKGGSGKAIGMDTPGSWYLKIFLGESTQTELDVSFVTEKIKIKQTLKERVDKFISSYTHSDLYQEEQEEQRIAETLIHEDKPVIAIAPFGIANQQNLQVINIGPKVQYVGLWAFSNDPVLREINVDPANEYFTSVDGVLFTKDMKKLVAYPMGKPGNEYVVPDGVEVIGDGAFYHFYSNDWANPLTKVVLPEGLLRIEDTAFFGNKNLVECDLPDSLTYIGTDAFSKCEKLGPYVYVPKTVEWIGEYAWYFCGNLDLISFEQTENNSIEQDAQMTIPPQTGKIVFNMFWKPKIDPAPFQTNYPAILFGLDREAFTEKTRIGNEKLADMADIDTAHDRSSEQALIEYKEAVENRQNKINELAGKEAEVADAQANEAQIAADWTAAQVVYDAALADAEQRLESIHLALAQAVTLVKADADYDEAAALAWMASYLAAEKLRDDNNAAYTLTQKELKAAQTALSELLEAEIAAAEAEDAAAAESTDGEAEEPPKSEAVLAAEAVVQAASEKNDTARIAYEEANNAFEEMRKKPFENAFNAYADKRDSDIKPVLDAAKRIDTAAMEYETQLGQIYNMGQAARQANPDNADAAQAKAEATARKVADRSYTSVKKNMNTLVQTLLALIPDAPAEVKGALSEENLEAYLNAQWKLKEALDALNGQKGRSVETKLAELEGKKNELQAAEDNLADKTAKFEMLFEIAARYNTESIWVSAGNKADTAAKLVTKNQAVIEEAQRLFDEYCAMVEGHYVTGTVTDYDDVYDARMDAKPLAKKLAKILDGERKAVKKEYNAWANSI
ncbi:MAG: leucine-rich repeat protein [Oscillospiraceae bacterium]|nr:leucine-rich repeat protein [Oscillospiraceae bacterium]